MLYLEGGVTGGVLADGVGVRLLRVSIEDRLARLPLVPPFVLLVHVLRILAILQRPLHHLLLLLRLLLLLLLLFHRITILLSESLIYNI